MSLSSKISSSTHFVSSEDKSHETDNAIGGKSSPGIRKITPFNYYTPR